MTCVDSEACAEGTLLIPTVKWKAICIKSAKTLLANLPPESVTVVDKTS